MSKSICDLIHSLFSASVSGGNINPPPASALLTEAGSFLLNESGGKILLG